MTKKANSFSIKQWSVEDRPREKLLHLGKNALTNAELLAILFGSGSRDESAVSLSKRILSSVENDLGDLNKLSLEKLMQFKGVGEAKGITLIAALELGRRLNNSKTPIAEKITSSKDAFEILRPLIADLPHEEFWVLFLNNGNKVLKKVQLSKGGITGTVVDVRLILKQALELSAVALVLGHNHPSGVLIPSIADKDLTKKLQTGAIGLDIKVLDHLIVAMNNYFSFADEGYL